MHIQNGLFSSESVSEGHPDKLADRISDRILDAFLELDHNARVACETMLADQCVIVAGEFKTKNSAVFHQVQSNAEQLVRQVLRETGYTDAATGIDPDKCEVQIRFNSQSEDISQGVDRQKHRPAAVIIGFDRRDKALIAASNKDIEVKNDDAQDHDSTAFLGAGDQGLMFGYACDETPELMPAPIIYAHRLVRKQAELRQSGVLPWLKPDAKSQVTFRYVDGRPTWIESVVLSTQHAEGISQEQLKHDVEKYIIYAVIPQELRSSNFKLYINPTGRFVIGGSKGDAGLTGRKIIVDTYGGAAPHGGGAFSGKDPSKVDRSAAYMARYLAKQIVARGWATKALIQLAYAIGVAKPVSFSVETFGTQTNQQRDITALLQEEFDLTPRGIINHLQLQRPIYYPTAAYGHFGRTDIDLPWEKI